MPSRPRSSIVLLGVVLALLPQVVLAAVARGVVVCEELDGRAAVEWSLTGCCSSAATKADGAPAGGWCAAPEDECVSCTDAPLGLTVVRGRDASTQAPPAPVPVPPSWHSLPVVACVGSLGRFQGLRAPPAPHLLQLSTVFLRC